MANGVGPGRVFPSVTGGGLSRAAGAIFEAQLAKRELAQRDRQLDVQESQNALAQITALIPLLERDTLVGELDAATQAQFGMALGVDPAEFQEVVLNRQTLASMIEAVTINRVEGLTDEEKVKDEVFRAQLGLEPLQEVADLERGVADIQLEGLVALRTDPARRLDFQQRFQGLDPTTVTFPNGDTMDFDTGAEAQLYVTLLGQESASDYQFAKLDADTKAAAVANIRDQMKERQFLIGDPAIVRLFQIYDQAVALEREAAEAGQPGGAGQALLDAFQASGADEGEKIALNLISGAIPFGEQHLLGDLALPLQRGAALAELLVKIESADPDQLSGLLDQLPEAAFGSIEKVGPFSFFGFGTSVFTLPPGTPGTGTREQVGTGQPPPIPQLSREQEVRAVRENLNTMTRDQLVAESSEEIVVAAEALGPLEPGETPEPTPDEPDVPGAPGEPEPEPQPGVDAADRDRVITSEERRLDRLLQLRENMAGGGTSTQFVDATIAELRTEISIQQAAVSFGDDGMIVVDSVPASVREAAASYNRIQQILNRTTSGAGRRRRVGNQQTLLRQIKTAIAQG